MKRYQSHKIVEAARINSCGFEADGSGWVQYYETNGETIHTDLSSGFVRAGHIASPGDYIVRYDGDYLSWSPKDKFEAGYTEVGETDVNGFPHTAATSKNWMDTAAQHLRNEEYCCGLVQQIGAMLGDAAYTDDGGELHDSVLCAKVPELVREALAKRTRPMGGEPAQLDIAKALRDAYGRGADHVEQNASEQPETAEQFWARRDAWIAQYMARLPGAELVAQTGMAAGDWKKLMGKEQTQVDDVTVTVSAPPGKRAVVVRNGAGGTTSTQTVVGGQSHSFTVGRDDVLLINEGEQHSTVAHQGE